MSQQLYNQKNLKILNKFYIKFTKKIKIIKKVLNFYLKFMIIFYQIKIEISKILSDKIVKNL